MTVQQSSQKQQALSLMCRSVDIFVYRFFLRAFVITPAKGVMFSSVSVVCLFVSEQDCAEKTTQRFSQNLVER